MYILSEVKIFCEQKNMPGALLLTGKWGCGKTYFINQIFMKDPEVKEKYAVVKISLFGINTVEQFNHLLKKEYLKLKYPTLNSLEGNNKSKGIDMAKKVISQLSPMAEVILSADWSDFIEIEKFDGKEVILIFDDLERCFLEIETILGLLNEYIENKGIKTILIANEEYITDDAKRDEIQKQRYEEMREKIISRTIRIVPFFTDVINTLIKEYSAEEDRYYRTFLEKNKSVLEEIFVESKTENIRSFKCAIQEFNRFYDVIIKTIESEIIVEQLLYNYLVMVFENKQGNFNSKSEEEYGGIFGDSRIKKIYQKFNSSYKLESMKEWIFNGIWNENLLASEVKYIYNLNKDDMPEKKLLNCPDLTYASDELLQNGFSPLLKIAYDGGLSLNEYNDFFNLLISSDYYKIDLPEYVDVNKLKAGINTRIMDLKNGVVKEDANNFRGIHSENRKYLQDDMLELIDFIKSFREEMRYLINRHTILNALRTHNVKDVNEWIEKYTGPIDEEYVNEIIKYWKELESEHKRSFINRLVDGLKSCYVYSKGNRDDTRKWIQEMINTLESVESKNTIASAMDRLLIEGIKEVKDKYDN